MKGVTVRIGELADETGVSVRSLRYYEEQGLLGADRSTSGQRVYPSTAVDRVRLLRRLYGAGLNSATIGSLLPCVDTPSEAVSSKALDVMQREYDRIGSQLEELATTREHLAYLIGAAQAHHRTQLDEGRQNGTKKGKRSASARHGVGPTRTGVA